MNFIYHHPIHRHHSDCFRSCPNRFHPSCCIRHLNRCQNRQLNCQNHHNRHQSRLRYCWCRRRHHSIHDRDRGRPPHSQALCIQALDAWCACISCACDDDVWHELVHGSIYADGYYRPPSTSMLLRRPRVTRLTEKQKTKKKKKMRKKNMWK